MPLHRLEKALLTDFFLATAKDASSIAEGTFRAPDYSTSNADNSVLAALWGAIDGFADNSRLASEECLVAMGSPEGPWVFALPEDMILRLSELPEPELLTAAERWAKSEEMFYHRVSGTDLMPSLTLLKSLAEKAQSTGRSLLLRMAM